MLITFPSSVPSSELEALLSPASDLVEGLFSSFAESPQPAKAPTHMFATSKAAITFFFIFLNLLCFSVSSLPRIHCDYNSITFSDIL